MGTFIATLSLGFIVAFSYLYLKDKDPRKLLFIIVFFFGIITQIPFIFQEWNELQIFPNIGLWAGLTPVSGIIITLTSTIFQEKDFKKSFYLFLIIAAISIVIIVLPFQLIMPMYQVYVALSIFMISLSAFLIIKQYSVPNLMFLFATIFYILAEFGLNSQMLNPETVVVAFISAHIFMALIFLSSKGKNIEGIGSFFSYKIELEKTKKRLKKSEERLQKSEKMAAIGQAATMVGHDLRNPLQAIQNATYCVESHLNNLDKENPSFQKSLKMLQIIDESIEYANNIVLDLKDFSSNRKPQLTMVNVNDLLTDSLSVCRLPDNVKIIKELLEIPLLQLDKVMMKRIFVNIITNGVQAIPNGGTLKVSAKQIKNFVEVSVKDSGKGISKESLKKLFSPFFTTKAQGMGMGLAICKKFIESNGGFIEVESEEDKGSKFTIKLPC